MGLNLGILAVAVASFSQGLHALDQQSKPGLLTHSLKTRQPQPQPPATCTYTAPSIAEHPTGWGVYTLLIDLPGDLWEGICTEPKVIQPMLDTIERRCIQTWSHKGSSRRFGGELKAVVNEWPCHITIKVETLSGQPFADDCILDPHPQPCGYGPQVLPWPSDCVLITNLPDPLVMGRKHSSHDRYTFEEDALLKKLYREGNSWQKITESFPRRTPQALKRRLKILLERESQSESNPHLESLKSKDRDFWTDEQDEILVRLRLEGSSWEDVVAALPLPERTANAARSRFQHLKENHNIKSPLRDKSRYGSEEDQMILKLKGEGKSWSEIAEALPGPKRSDAALYIKYMRLIKLHGLERAPTVARMIPWTPEEDQLLLELKKGGMPWPEVEKAFPQRTLESLKSRYLRTLKLAREQME